MSRSWSRRRARLFAAGAEGARDTVLVGRDWKRPAGRSRRSHRGLWLPLIVGGLTAALFLVSLRTSILALRYDLDRALARELDLMKQRRGATAALRELRDPARLAILARERGFVRPEKVIDLGAGAARP